MEKSGKPNRIPRENLHDDNGDDTNERLTQKHIQTLGFLQEIVNENKALKERVLELEEHLEESQDMRQFAAESKEKIKDIQESYLTKSDEMMKMLVEKHRVEMTQLENEKFELERELKEQILKMRHEIHSLNDANKDLRTTAAEEDSSNDMKSKLKESLKHCQAFRKENEELRTELEDVKSDMEILQSKRAGDMNQVRELRTETKQLSETVQELKQTNNEVQFRLDQAMSELRDKANNQDETNLIENLKTKIELLTVEREAGVEREIQLGKDLLDLNVMKDAIKQMNLHLQSELERLLAEYGYLNSEYERLRKRSMKDKSAKTFKDFVSLKRELRTVKYENEALKCDKGERIAVLKEEVIPPLAIELPKKKNSLEGKRSGAKKLLAISHKYGQTAEPTSSQEQI